MTSLHRGVRSTFSSLSVRNYRLFFVGQMVSITGTFMQMVAQSWLVLNLTGSPAALGVVTACQWLPTLILGPYAGVVADRVDKRRLLMATQSFAMVLALLLGVLTATGRAQLWMVIALAGALGVGSAFESPARQSFVLEMVGPAKLTNAVSLNTITMNIGRLFGPAVAGIMIARWNLSVCFIANGLSYVAALAALVLMRRRELVSSHRTERAKGQLREGLRYVWGNPELKVPLLLMAVVGTLTFEFAVTLPVLAKDTFDVGAAGFGVMQSFISVGAIVGGLAFASRTAPTHRRLSLSAAAFGAAVIALALCPTFGISLGVLLLVGAGSMVFLTLANATLQLVSAPEMRSRVMALYGVAFLGSTPIGGPIVGWITQAFGVRWGLAIGGVAALGAAAYAVRALRAGRTPSIEVEAELAPQLSAQAA
jgi:MFS family permease